MQSDLAVLKLSGIRRHLLFSWKHDSKRRLLLSLSLIGIKSNLLLLWKDEKISIKTQRYSLHTIKILFVIAENKELFALFVENDVAKKLVSLIENCLTEKSSHSTKSVCIGGCSSGRLLASCECGQVFKLPIFIIIL